MKVLHIGYPGMMERFSAPDSMLYRLERADMNVELPTEEYLKAAGDADFIVVDAVAHLNGDLIRAMPNLKAIHSEGVAYNKIDLEAAKERGIPVCNSAGTNAKAVAEQTVLLMVGMLRDILRNDRRVRNGEQRAAQESYLLNGGMMELSECTVGLLGFGATARATARLLRAYGVEHILYHKRSPLSPAEEAELGVEHAPLDELLRRSDIVSLHMPVTDETRHLADREFFAQMKQGAYLVNTARGELVDNEALSEALKSGRLAMAGLDTLDGEPATQSHPLLDCEVADRIIFSPHAAGITGASLRRCYSMVWEDFATVLRGENPKRNVIR